jgi:uncharacterized membrane protein
MVLREALRQRIKGESESQGKTGSTTGFIAFALADILVKSEAWVAFFIARTRVGILVKGKSGSTLLLQV